MEALFSSLVAKYGFDYAAKLLGLDKQQENPKYAISLGNINLNPMNMIKRAGLNQGIKSLMSGNIGGMGMGLPLIAGGLALAYMRNPLREGSMNYNPYLKDQIDYASSKGYLATNPNSGLMQYGPGSVLRGQNVSSMFGTNNYRDQLEKKKNYFENRISKNKNYSQTQYEKTLKEIGDFEKAEVNRELAAEEKAKNQITKNIMTQNNAYTGGGGGGNQGQRNAGPGFSGSGTAAEMGSFKRGGIASL